MRIEVTRASRPTDLAFALAGPAAGPMRLADVATWCADFAHAWWGARGEVSTFGDTGTVEIDPADASASMAWKRALTLGPFGLVARVADGEPGAAAANGERMREAVGGSGGTGGGCVRFAESQRLAGATEPDTMRRTVGTPWQHASAGDEAVNGARPRLEDETGGPVDGNGDRSTAAGARAIAPKIAALGGVEVEPDQVAPPGRAPNDDERTAKTQPRDATPRALGTLGRESAPADPSVQAAVVARAIADMGLRPVVHIVPDHDPTALTPTQHYRDAAVEKRYADAMRAGAGGGGGASTGSDDGEAPAWPAGAPPIVAAEVTPESRRILDGHHRMRAAVEVGLTAVPVVTVDAETVSALQGGGTDLPRAHARKGIDGKAIAAWARGEAARAAGDRMPRFLEALIGEAWDPDLHPRDEAGRFAAGGGGASVDAQPAEAGLKKSHPATLKAYKALAELLPARVKVPKMARTSK